MLARDNLRRHAAGPLGGLALVVLCCTVYLPGFFSIPPVDRDESRFAQASRQMFESVALPAGERDPELHSGGLAVPMVGGKPRLNKPPLIYWLQAGSAAVLTGGRPLEDAIWMYRVPSLLAGFVIVLATWRIGCSMFDPRVGWVGGCLLAVSPVFVWEAHQARADMVMVAWTVLAMGQLFQIWRRSGSLSRPRRERAGERASSASRSRPLLAPFLLWVFIALGVLTKGPITPMVVVMAAAWLSVFSRDWRWLRSTRPVLGVAIVVAAVAPWVWAVARQVGFGEYWSIVYDEVFARAGSAKEGHWGPPGYHLVLLVVLFWPGSLLTGLSLGRAWRKGYQSRGRKHAEHREAAGDEAQPGSASLRSRLRGLGIYLAGLRATRRPEAFLIAWMIPSWIVFELVGTKLPHYTMPLYPAVALITARGLFAAAGSRLVGVLSTTSQFGFAIWSLILFALAFFTVSDLPAKLIMHEIDAYRDTPASLRLVVTLATILATGFSLRYLSTHRWAKAQASSLLLSLCIAWGVLAGFAPRFFGLTHRVHARVAELDPGGMRPVATTGFFEDSMAFLWRTRIEWIESDAAVEWVELHPDGILIAPAELGVELGLTELGSGAVGTRYTKGRTVVLRLWGAGSDD